MFDLLRVEFQRRESMLHILEFKGILKEISNFTELFNKYL